MMRKVTLARVALAGTTLPVLVEVRRWLNPAGTPQIAISAR
jgi:hypothetical protein